MQVNIIEEAGYNTALYGFSLSYKDRAIPREEWWNFTRKPEDHKTYVVSDVYLQAHLREQQVRKTATANSGRGNGHDKWLRQVVVWIDIEAPRYFWSEFDTYKVGTVAQSESTMHTLSRRDMQLEDLEPAKEPRMQSEQVSNFYKIREWYKGDIVELKKHIPESYLQRRVVSLNYAVLRCIIEQRKNHRLPEWKFLIDALYEQCQHPELLPKRD